MATLRQTAQAMRQGLEWSKQAGKEAAWNLRTLPRGLQLLLSFNDERWRLALRRTDVAPSEEEVELCMAAFDVPAGCGRRNFAVGEKDGVTHRKTVYQVVELTWREVEAFASTGQKLAASAAELAGVGVASGCRTSPATAPQGDVRGHLLSASAGE